MEEAQVVIKMRLRNILLIILAFLIVLNTAGAERYITYEFKEGIISDGSLTVTNNSIDNVNVIGFVCADSSCSAVSNSLWNGAVLNSGNASNITLTYPTSLQSNNGYAVYYFKDGFIPWESNPNWWGTSSSDPQGPYEVVLSKKDVCSAHIDSFNMLNNVQPNIPLVISIDAGLDASTYAAIQNGGDLDYIPPSIEHYYSVETKISLRIYNSSNAIVEEQIKTVNIPYSGASTIEFNWTPTIQGDYSAVINTNVTDSKCLSSKEYSVSKGFHVLSGDPRNMCYSLLNGVYVSDIFPFVNETVNINGNRISNYAADDYSLTSVPTNLTVQIMDEFGTIIGSTSGILSANANSYDPAPFQISYLADSVGSFGLIVSATPNSSLCENLTNIPEVVVIDIIVQPRNYSGNQPPELSGIPNLIINESETPPANWIDLWNYSYDVEDSDNQLQFNIISQTNPSLINCQISNNRYLNCELSPESYGFSDILVQVRDTNNAVDRDSFRITVNEVITRPIITNIPNINIDEDGSAVLNLNLYVTDPNNNNSELNWAAAGNNHTHINIDNNNIAAITADRNWFGTENILFTVTDPEGYNDSENVTITVNSQEDAPAINPFSISFNEDGYIILNLSNYVTDLDNNLNELIWSISGGNHISALINKDIITFTAEPDWYGSETFILAVKDPDGFSSSINLVVNVVNINDPPVINLNTTVFDYNLGVKEEIKINLNDYITDLDNSLSELEWSYTAGNHLDVLISRDNIATIKTKTKLGTFTITFTAVDPDGAIASFVVKIHVSYIQKNSDLVLDNIRILNEFLRPGDELIIDVGLRNQGYLDFDDIKVSAMIYDLGIYHSLTRFDLDELDNANNRIILEIPEYAPRGIYDVRIVVSNDYMRRVVNREFFII